MEATQTNVSRLRQLRLYLFLSASALNVFLAFIIVANSLSISYYLYGTPMVIQIDLLPQVWTTLLWIGSLYVLYTTKEVVAENPSSHRINWTLNVALVGSFFLIASVIFSSIGSSAQPSTELFFNQLSSWTSSFGYVLSFGGSMFALFTVLVQTRSLVRLFLVYLFSLLIPIEILSLMHWIAYPFDVVANFGFAWNGAFLELQLFYVVYPLVFWLFIVLLFSWIWLPLLKKVKEKARVKGWGGLSAFLRGSLGFGAVSSRTAQEEASHIPNFNRKFLDDRLLPIAILLVSLVFGVFIAYYPYLSRRPGLVGTDSLGYYYTLTALDGKDLFKATLLANEINSARVLYHLMLYAFRNLSQLPASTIIEIVPIVTIMANALAVFWFVKAAGKKTLTALLSAVFSIFSFATVISMHAGTFANWLAVALGFVLFGLVLKLHDEKKPRLLLAVIPTLAVVFLIHYWSGLFFMAVLVCYMFLVLWEPLKLRVKLLTALGLLALAVFAIFLASSAMSRLPAPYNTLGSFVESTFLPESLVAFWTRLPILIDVWFLGALANPVMLGLALVGMVVCLQQKSNFSRLLISWIIVGSVLSIFVSPIGETMNQWLLWRTLYLVPFEIPAAFGACFFISKLGTLEHSENARQLTAEANKRVFSLAGSQRNPNFLVVLYLVIEYVVSAILALNFSILLSIVVFNFLALSMILHFRIRGQRSDPILVSVFMLFIGLVLSNYVLRSLAPLAVSRWQP